MKTNFVYVIKNSEGAFLSADSRWLPDVDNAIQYPNEMQAKAHSDGNTVCKYLRTISYCEVHE